MEKLKEFIKSIKNDPFWTENNGLYIDYLNFVYNQIKDKKQNYKLDREDLEDKLEWILSDYEDLNEDIMSYELEDLEKLNKLIAKELLPIWQDNSQWYNLGALIKHYDLDIDELYFDVDNNVIRDKEGNIWAD